MGDWLDLHAVYVNECMRRKWLENDMSYNVYVHYNRVINEIAEVAAMREVRASAKYFGVQGVMFSNKREITHTIPVVCLLVNWSCINDYLHINQ